MSEWGLTCGPTFSVGDGTFVSVGWYSPTDDIENDGRITVWDAVTRDVVASLPPDEVAMVLRNMRDSMASSLERRTG